MLQGAACGGAAGLRALDQTQHSVTHAVAQVWSAWSPPPLPAAESGAPSSRLWRASPGKHGYTSKHEELATKHHRTEPRASSSQEFHI